VDPDVNDELAPVRNRRSARTEQAILTAAGTLFVAHGWRGTTLAEVARTAGVGDRTVYVRFGTKAALFSRVLDVAITGDTDPDWVHTTMTAPTASARIAALATGTSALYARLGPLLPALREAEADDPQIAARAQATREDTARQNVAFWTALADDGLLGPGVDRGWVTETSTLLGAADTYLLMMQTLHWTPERYRRWRRETWTRLATS
jgi:AcrR family transcriptional regulator